MIAMGGVGIAMIVARIRIRKGLDDRSWWMTSVVLSGQAPFVMIPSGIALTLLAVGAFAPWDWLQSLFLGAGLISSLVAAIFWGVRPRFLKPEWLRWLEDDHRNILLILRREALHVGSHRADRTRTRPDMEQWVAEVRRKHGLGKH
jgi:MFS family permease